MGGRKALGRGLAALVGDQAKVEQKPIQDIPDVSSESQTERVDAPISGVRLMPVDQILPNPDQPRQSFDTQHLRELSESIARDGLLQPLVVREEANRYYLIAGERRWRAAQMAGLAVVPALIHRIQESTDALRLALIENIQRQDLNPLETARAYKELMDRCGLTQDQLAKEVSRSRSGVANMLRLLALPEDVQRWLAEGKLSMGHARALLGVADPAKLHTLAQRVVRDGLSVREIEGIVNPKSDAPAPDPVQNTQSSSPTKEDPYYASLADKIRQRLGTKVHISHNDDGAGKIVIQYFAPEELEGILAVLAIDLDA